MRTVRILACIVALGVAACAPPQPLDTLEEADLRAARDAGAAEVTAAATACLTDSRLATNTDVLVCIFGSDAVAAAPNRTPSRGDRLRDGATDAVGNIIGALGNRGAAEIEGR